MLMDRTGQLLAYTGSWRGVQPCRGTGVEPGGLWSREFIAFISKIFIKVNTWGLLRERAGFGGPICSRADPHFKAKNHPLNRKNWNAHGVMPTYSVIPPGKIHGQFQRFSKFTVNFIF
jgi:hypothetical protein